jgi:hypothetical protein
VAKAPEKSELVKAYLRRLGNPYASLQIVDDVEEVEATKVLRDEQHPYVRHPYALISEAEEAQETASDPIAKLPVSPTRGTLSKAEFRARCRRIFQQYIPALEKGRLRTHHRDFITRNESRLPTTRHLLVGKLEKYDLSRVQGLTAHFNREREQLTDEKLKQIERLVGSDN